MVVIGGGVPNNNLGVDLRLGDVVVSTPSKTSSGVIQYDYGKAVDGHLLPTGVLNKPPSFLLTAVSKLESDALLGTRPVAALISKVLEDHPDMNDQFSRPDEDWQFNCKYRHRRSSDGSSKSDSRVRDCSACDPGERVAGLPRISDVPSIHHGIIASGNQVIKDAEKRDSLARELGVLCFEMEAAGLMDQLPSLVIRGISDYCDSYKNDHWQGYAALVASAYSKVLLAEVPALSHGMRASGTPLEG
jgi:nucleoside phosphorylase